mmetsp:Transcript_2585/g.7366  ORF Transcript_2585/g.7366 Transcript_2585/m.7366 type:complete len:227 (+) Transcript_2585:558-1238(+)
MLSLVARPVRRWRRYGPCRHGVRAGVSRELLLVAWALQVPKDASSGFNTSCVFRWFGHATEFVRYLQYVDLRESGTHPVLPRARPTNRSAAASRLGAAVVLQDLNVGAPAADLQVRGPAFQLQQLLTPPAHEERQRPCGRVPLGQLLRWRPPAGHVVRYTVQSKTNNTTELQHGAIGHATLEVPLQNRPVLRHLETPRALQVLLEHRDDSFRTRVGGHLSVGSRLA